MTDGEINPENSNNRLPEGQAPSPEATPDLEHAEVVATNETQQTENRLNDLPRPRGVTLNIRPQTNTTYEAPEGLPPEITETLTEAKLLGYRRVPNENEDGEFHFENLDHQTVHAIDALGWEIFPSEEPNQYYAIVNGEKITGLRNNFVQFGPDNQIIFLPNGWNRNNTTRYFGNTAPEVYMDLTTNDEN